MSCLAKFATSGRAGRASSRSMLPLLSNTRTTSATKLQAGALGGDGGLADTLAASALSYFSGYRAPPICGGRSYMSLRRGAARLQATASFEQKILIVIDRKKTLVLQTLRERFLKTNHDSHSDLGSAACQPSAEAGAGPVAERAARVDEFDAVGRPCLRRDQRVGDRCTSWCHQVTG